MRSILTLAALGGALIATACSGGGYGGGGITYGGGGGGGGTQSCATSPLSGPITVTAALGISSCNDTTAGVVLGFSDSGAKAQVIVVHTNQNIKFHNGEGFPHSADLLGTFASQSSWPGSYSGAPAASAGGTAISASGFSTGALAGGADSATYTTGSATGMYMIGCRFHYNSNGMRTLIVVQ